MPITYGSRGPRDKRLGAIPLVAEYGRRLDIAGIVDRLCPIRDVSHITHGQVVEVLIANRLTSPEPLVHIEEWAEKWAVEEVYGVLPRHLNDDRIGRALDAMAQHLDGMVGSIGAKAIEVFGVDVSRLHWDMTSISLFGDYEAAEEGFVLPHYGHPKDGRTDLKQVQTGFAVAADGGIPVYHRAFDGGAAEVSQVIPAMEALSKLAGERPFLLVGDAKLVSKGNLRAIVASGRTFIAPAPKNIVGTDILRSLDLASARDVDYTARRDVQRSASGKAYKVLEDTFTIPGERRGDATLTLRRIFVWSEARAEAAVANRQRKLARARDDLERLGRALGSRHYPDAAAVRTRLDLIAARHHVEDVLRTSVDTDDRGRPTLSWDFDEKSIAMEAATDGWYPLLTNLPLADADAAEVLRRYKGQEAVERRYGNFKGPLAVAPFFLKSNRRIEALVAVIALALLIFSLAERALRIAILPAEKLPDLQTRRPARPTGRLIFRALHNIALRPASRDGPALIPELRPLEAKILQLLAIDPTRERF